MKVKYNKSVKNTPFVVDLRNFGSGRKHFATKQDALDYIENQKKQIEGVRTSRENKFEWTFQMLIDQYMERLKTRKNSHNKQRSMFEFEKVSIDGMKLAEMKVREFVVGDLDELLMAIKSKRTPKKGKRTPKTQREVMAHFRQLLDFAVTKGVVSLNVFRQLASGLDYGDRNKVKLTKISKEIIHKIAKNIAPIGTNSICQRKLMFLFSAYTGLRSGEMRALEWSDVDLENEEINVNKVVFYRRHYSTDEKGKRKEKGSFEIRHSTKTENGMRNVPIVSWLATMLKEFKLEQGQPSGRVFPSSTGGVLSGTRLREYMQDACERADVDRIRWHDLRHYFASVMLQVYGGDFNRIKTYMGHSSIKTTIDIYSHWIENLEEKQEAKDKLNESLGKFGAMV